MSLFPKTFWTSHTPSYGFCTQQCASKKSGCFCLFGLYFFYSGFAVTWQLIHHGRIVCVDEERHVSIAGNKDITSQPDASFTLRLTSHAEGQSLHLYILSQGCKKTHLSWLNKVITLTGYIGFVIETMTQNMTSAEIIEFVIFPSSDVMYVSLKMIYAMCQCFSGRNN